MLSQTCFDFISKQDHLIEREEKKTQSCLSIMMKRTITKSPANRKKEKSKNYKQKRAVLFICKLVISER
jgi:hypothetical protein